MKADDRRMMGVTGQGRTETLMPAGAGGPNTHCCSCLQPQTSESPQSPPQERKPRQRLGEKRFGKKRLLIGLRYSCYRVSLDCRGARPARHAW